MVNNFITRKTFEKISEELRQIKEVEIPKISKAKKLAAEEGDLSENAEYIACKEKLELLHSQYENVKARIANPSFIDDLRIPGTLVSIGTTVKILDLDSNEKYVYTILGSADADIDNNIISFTSPIAKGMIGKKEGFQTEITIPEGTRKIKILSIKKFNN